MFKIVEHSNGRTHILHKDTGQVVCVIYEQKLKRGHEKLLPPEKYPLEDKNLCNRTSLSNLKRSHSYGQTEKSRQVRNSHTRQRAKTYSPSNCSSLPNTSNYGFHSKYGNGASSLCTTESNLNTVSSDKNSFLSKAFGLTQTTSDEPVSEQIEECNSRGLSSKQPNKIAEEVGFSSFLGRKVIETFPQLSCNGCTENLVYAYENFCNTINIVQENGPALRSQGILFKYPITYRPFKSWKLWASHMYCFSKNDKIERNIVLRTGLNKRARLLKSVCKGLNVCIKKLSNAEITKWILHKSSTPKISAKPNLKKNVYLSSFMWRGPKLCLKRVTPEQVEKWGHCESAATEQIVSDSHNSEIITSNLTETAWLGMFKKRNSVVTNGKKLNVQTPNTRNGLTNGPFSFWDTFQSFKCSVVLSDIKKEFVRSGEHIYVKNTLARVSNSLSLEEKDNISNRFNRVSSSSTKFTLPILSTKNRSMNKDINVSSRHYAPKVALLNNGLPNMNFELMSENNFDHVTNGCMPFPLAFQTAHSSSSKQWWDRCCVSCPFVKHSYSNKHCMHQTWLKMRGTFALSSGNNQVIDNTLFKPKVEVRNKVVLPTDCCTNAKNISSTVCLMSQATEIKMLASRNYLLRKQLKRPLLLQSCPLNECNGSTASKARRKMMDEWQDENIFSSLVDNWLVHYDELAQSKPSEKLVPDKMQFNCYRWVFSCKKCRVVFSKCSSQREACFKACDHMLSIHKILDPMLHLRVFKKEVQHCTEVHIIAFADMAKKF